MSTYYNHPPALQKVANWQQPEHPETRDKYIIPYPYERYSVNIKNNVYVEKHKVLSIRTQFINWVGVKP